MSEVTDDFLQHYGVAGMKWGKRGSKKQTGVSRSGGAIIDRNTRSTKMLNDARNGVKYKKRVALGKKLIGSDKWEKNYQTSISNMTSQNSRIRAGKTTLSDKIDMAVNLSVLERVVSIRPKG